MLDLVGEAHLEERPLGDLKMAALSPVDGRALGAAL